MFPTSLILKDGSSQQLCFCVSATDNIIPSLNQLAQHAAKAKGGDQTLLESAVCQRHTGDEAICENYVIIAEVEYRTFTFIIKSKQQTNWSFK